MTLCIHLLRLKPFQGHRVGGQGPIPAVIGWGLGTPLTVKPSIAATHIHSMSMVNLECPVNLILYGGLFSERKPQIVHSFFLTEFPHKVAKHYYNFNKHVACWEYGHTIEKDLATAQTTDLLAIRQKSQTWLHYKPVIIETRLQRLNWVSWITIFNCFISYSLITAGRLTWGVSFLSLLRVVKIGWWIYTREHKTQTMRWQNELWTPLLTFKCGHQCPGTCLSRTYRLMNWIIYSRISEVVFLSSHIHHAISFGHLVCATYSFYDFGFIIIQ